MEKFYTSCEKIDLWVNKHKLIQFICSYDAVAFFYGIFLFLYEIKFMRNVVPIVHPALIIWAIFVSTYNLFVRRQIGKYPRKSIILAFIVLTAISAIINMKAGFWGNVKAWILTILPLFAFFLVCYDKPKEKREETFLRVLSGGAVVIFIASFISLILYIIRYDGYYELFGVKEHIGLYVYDSTNPQSGLLLFGVHYDTNHAAMYAIAFAGYSLILFNHCKRSKTRKKSLNILGKIFAVLNFIVQICYFPLANSRGGWLCLFVATTVTLLFFLWKNNMKKSFSEITKIILSFALALSLAVVSLSALLAVRQGMVGISTIVAKNEITSEANKEGATDSSDSEDKNTGRDLDKINNFNKPNEVPGSGRLELWEEALKLYTKHPILGTGGENNVYYSNYYGIGCSFVQGKAVHNSYLDLLVNYGAVGFLLLISFFIGCLRLVLKNLFDQERNMSFSYYVVFLLTVMMSGVMGLLSCAFINTTAMYYLLLVFCGFLEPKRMDVELSHESKD